MDAVAETFGREFGGREIARFREPSWDGLQLAFDSGIRLEVLQPIDDPRDDFLERFLEHSGPGPHHVTFKVADIEDSLAWLAGMGVEPTKVDLTDPNWKEAFLHPRLGLGTVVQLAQPGGVWAAQREPEPAPDAAVRASFLGAELAVEMETARRIFGELLGGEPHELGDGRVAYSWDGGGTLSLQPADGDRPQLLALVFRGSDGHVELGKTPLFDGPSTVVRLGPSDTWPR